MLAPLLMKTFPKDPKLLDRKVKLFKSELRPLGNWKQAAWLPSNEEGVIVVRFQPPTIKVAVAHF